MTIAILHLTDIHIKHADDAILSRSKQVAAAIKRHLEEASKVIFLLSGDIAQAGLKTEYDLAENFLTAIKSEIESEFHDKDIVFVIAPGNHDCDFSKANPVREAVLKSIEDSLPELPDDFIDICTSSQRNFEDFRERMSSDVPKSRADKLWQTYDVESEGKHIYFDVLNASWMSSRHEQQGGLIFPFERYEGLNAGDADLRICVLHHPYGWYSQKNQLKFRAFLQGLSDIIFTGHEHESNARVAEDLVNGECAYVEGSALFERGTGQSGFNVVVLDLANEQFQYVVYGWSRGRYEPTDTHNWREYRAMPKRASGEFDFSEAFQRELTDVGATLRHPSGRELALDDIYVFPDLDSRSEVRSERKRVTSALKPNSRQLVQQPKSGKSVLIEGEENAGKTRLLYQLARRYHLQGLVPIYLKGDRLRGGVTETQIDGFIRTALQLQYRLKAYESFLQLERDKKVLLLDDFDACRIKGEHRSHLLERLLARFSFAVVTVGEDYELSEMLSSSEMTVFSGFDTYRISPFGYQRRGELIRKWVALGATEETGRNELLRIEDHAAKLIEAARLQHVASTAPIFILSLLQGWASGLSTELQNSSFASYYHFLIVGALEKAKVSRDAMQSYIAACTHLSWFVKRHGIDRSITEFEFRRFVEDYSKTWTATNADKLLDVLVGARILNKEGDNISFAYPYAYYYFLGNYAKISIGTEEVRDYLQYCMQHLYVRECANTLLFLAHHTGTSAVLDHLVESLKRHFSNVAAATFSKDDVAKVRELVSAAPRLKYTEKRPEEYREDQAKWRDENDSGSDGLRDKPRTDAVGQDFPDEIVSLTKSIEIAGALLSHQFPNYTRDTKEVAIKELFDAAMRAVRTFFGIFEHGEAEQLVQAMVGRIAKKEDDTNRAKIEKQIRLVVGWGLRAIATGFVYRAGTILTAPELEDNVTAVIAANPTNANRLIRLARILSTPAPLPKVEIELLVKEESDNVCVMGVLQSLLLHRIYMYETKHSDRDWAFSVFELGGHSKAIELRHLNRPGNPK
ncbi:metallophosphoesterase [Niveibacterium microcysteis]|uniref:Metallophosphoesterase n=1 Tax=Niveibacterium microcysteis TaxID=2811415 RepID=A0ABX7MAL0_9RHOO|nr:metallophosphoesterase [Niveibacterium microcysteis]QSI78786.1 metallophosphoesterase [Niveibacterium microcysteis]